MAVQTTKTNKPLNPRGNDQSPKGYNRAALYSGKALDFDGVNDVLSLDGYTTFTGDFSLSMYIKTSTILQRGLLTDSANNDALTLLTPDEHLMIRIDGINHIWDTGLPIYNDYMNHLVVVRSGSEVTPYLNGVSGNSVTATNGTFAFNQFGRQTTSANYFNGQAANIKAFDVALTAAQVADLYNNPEKVVPTGVDNTALKLWLPMMEGAGTTAYDGSGNGNHGTISGATYVNGVGAPVAQTAVIDWNKGVNRLLYSNKFDEATWQKLVGSSVSATRVDGPYSEQAWSVTYDGTSAGRIEQVVSGITNGTSYTCEVWARSTSGSVLVTLGGGGTETSHTLTTEWQLIDDVKNATFTTGYPRLRCDSAATIEVFGFSFRLTSEADLYIPTLTTAQPTPVLLPAGLTSGRDITGVNLFENVRKQGALNLDGNSWAEVHDNASLDITGHITLEAWVQIKDGMASDGVLGRWAASLGYLLYLNASNDIRFYVNGLDIRYTGLTNGWHHIVGLYDGSAKKLYVDGAEVSSSSQSVGAAASTAPIEIGRYQQSTGNTFDGPIAQPRIYNRALTAEEVQRNYNAGKNTYTN